ncbi:MAG: ribonuclease H [Thermoprotei archaeon]|nr:MAG: ribonuclease H [Thermoprotei archaeon]RLE97935.1 MAG: ribonuclease H [Thermoprotei archaeon]
MPHLSFGGVKASKGGDIIVVYFDGACEPINPGGVATYGFVIYRGDRRLHKGSGVAAVGEGATNNVAEYTALIRALEWLVEHGYVEGKLVVRGDSQLAIRQLSGLYAVRSPRIRPLYGQVVRLLRNFKQVKFEWIPRNLNWEADALSREAFRKFCRENKEFMRRFQSR